MAEKDTGFRDPLKALKAVIGVSFAIIAVGILALVQSGGDSDFGWVFLVGGMVVSTVAVAVAFLAQRRR